MKVRLVLLFLVAASAVARSEASANLGGVPSKRLKMQYATGLLLKFQICVSWGYRQVFQEYMRVISQRYPDIRIEGENYFPQPIYRHIASFLSVFKLVLIGLIIVGKDPFAFFGMQAPSIWQWGQENKVCNLLALATIGVWVVGEKGANDFLKLCICYYWLTVK